MIVIMIHNTMLILILVGLEWVAGTSEAVARPFAVLSRDYTRSYIVQSTSPKPSQSRLNPTNPTTSIEPKTRNPNRKAQTLHPHALNPAAARSRGWRFSCPSCEPTPRSTALLSHAFLPGRRFLRAFSFNVGGLPTLTAGRGFVPKTVLLVEYTFHSMTGIPIRAPDEFSVSASSAHLQQAVTDV